MIRTLPSVQIRLLHVFLKVILSTSHNASEEVSCFPAPLRCLNEERKFRGKQGVFHPRGGVAFGKNATENVR